MDDPAIDAERHVQALRGLRRLNRVSRSASILWRAIRAMAPARADIAGRASMAAPLRILDIATGSGDIPRALARLAAREGVGAVVEGCDKSERAIGVAREESAGLAPPPRFFTFDALAGPLPESYDVVVCSLFLHHLDDEQVVGLLGHMRVAARQAVVISDLQRSRRGYLVAWAASRLLSRSPVVHADALLSVRAAFTIEEMRGLADRAGLGAATIAPAIACRWLLEWRR